MSASASPIAPDRLAAIASPDVQRQAARMAQDGFARIFRLSLDGDEKAIRAAIEEMLPLCRNWARAGGGDEARALRMAMLVAGMDQWGLAYAQAFGLAAIPGLTELLGTLREGLPAGDDARFQQKFDALDAVETDAVDFKMELRRHIHLALWHAMIACTEREEAHRILGTLGGLLVGLTGLMPEIGWRLVADALAHIQIRCLGEAAASEGMAQETTQELFESLRRAMPKDRFDLILAHANQAAIAWQQAQRQQQASRTLQ